MIIGWSWPVHNWRLNDGIKKKGEGAVRTFPCSWWARKSYKGRRVVEPTSCHIKQCANPHRPTNQNHLCFFFFLSKTYRLQILSGRYSLHIRIDSIFFFPVYFFTDSELDEKESWSFYWALLNSENEAIKIS